MVFANTCEILSLLSKGRYFRGLITSGTLRYYDEMPASYPDVSLLMKMCAQRKAGRRPFPWSLAVHHQSLVSRSPLPCEKRRRRLMKCHYAYV